MTREYAIRPGLSMKIPDQDSEGFTYIGLLIFVAILSVSLLGVAESWQLSVRREKEKELLFIGEQFRRALDRYSNHALPGTSRYPRTLEDLLKDPRYPQTRRYLRRIYVDPMTGNSEWGLFRGPGGDIWGVYSLSETEPLKQHHFSKDNAAFEDKKKYSDWKFMTSGIRLRFVPVRQ